ncbi:MAG: amidohydrolase family protein [Anaerolineales bacterium]|nr:amidohydrolase family protein [Anaerolineales bacterium]
MTETTRAGGDIANRGYAVVAERLWDGVADTAQAGMAVWVEGDQIKTICPASQLPEGLPRIEHGDATVLPGLIDAHVHYTAFSGPLLLAAGVTTVRDTANDLDWILEQRAHNQAQPSEGPRIVCCGRALDGPNAHWPNLGLSHPTIDALRDSVRYEAERGVDQIKFYVRLKPDWLAAGIDEAHRQGLRAIAHMEDTKAEDAVQAGLDEIEHFAGCDAAWNANTPEERDTLIDLFLEHGVAAIPTLLVHDRLGRVRDAVFQYDTRNRWVHPTYLDFWRRYPLRNDPPNLRLHWQQTVPNVKRFTRQALERGMTIAAGTDALFPGMVPGYVLHDELAAMVDAGIRPVAVLRAATSVAADVLGLADQVGRIAPGYAADLLVVGGDPLVEIDCVADIRTVVRAGQVLDRDALHAEVLRRHSWPLEDAMTRDLGLYVNQQIHTPVSKK